MHLHAPTIDSMLIISHPAPLVNSFSKVFQKKDSFSSRAHAHTFARVNIKGKEFQTMQNKKQGFGSEIKNGLSAKIKAKNQKK